MTAKTLLLMVPVLMVLAACGQGYTPGTGDSGYNGYNGYNGYQGGAPVPAVMPEDRDRPRN